MSSADLDQQRRRDLAVIHAAAKQLAMAEDAYRALVERVSAAHGQPQRSAGQCSPQQLRAIIHELRRLGGASDPAARWRGRPKGALSPQLRKIEALLADNGRPWAYAHAIARRICKVERVEWCSMEQLGKVIAALQIDANRRKR